MSRLRGDCRPLPWAFPNICNSLIIDTINQNSRNVNAVPGKALNGGRDQIGGWKSQDRASDMIPVNHLPMDGIGFSQKLIGLGYVSAGQLLPDVGTAYIPVPVFILLFSMT